MATPPTQAAGSPVQTSWSASGAGVTVKTTPSQAVQAGDFLVAMATAEWNDFTLTLGQSGTAESYTQRQALGTSGSFSRAVAWTATAANTQTITWTVTSSVANKAFGLIVWTFRTHGGYGNSGGSTGTGSAPSVNFSPSADSALLAIIGDWSASTPGAGTSKYRTNVGAVGSELVYVANTGPGFYSAFVWDHPDTTGGAGQAVGSTSSMTWTLVGVEVLGAAGDPTGPANDLKRYL